MALNGVAVASRSCTGQGQVHVPCEDRLTLEPTEKFLLTLAGHGCYDITLRAGAPLSVSFYEAQGSLYAWRLREMQAIDPDIELLSGDVAPALAETMAAFAQATSGSTPATNVTGGTIAPVSAHLCDNSRSCHRVMRGLARGGVYNLVVAFARTEAGKAAEDGGEGVYLRLESCDQASITHIIGLLIVACIGFASALLCLCLLSEYVIGLQSLTKFRHSLRRPHMFVELTQMEPTKYTDDSGDHEDDDADAKLMDDVATAAA
ncbi:hypothetical protein PybrP1_007772 [[Pythium] brassicae (nom. inval.)]|nr:hypothetical protein PybrP1_007772 [[Pythium] brassicae (nom. inval.)]